MKRRHFIAGTSSLVVTALSQKAVWSQTTDDPNTLEIKRQFGVRDPLKDNPDIPFLRDAQNKIQSRSKKLSEFSQEITESPIMKRMKEGDNPNLYHFLQWHYCGLDLVSDDHTNLESLASDTTYAEQFGPHRSSRAMAMYHLALFEAINTIIPKAQSYRGVRSAIIAAADLRDTDNKHLPGTMIDASHVSVQAALAFAGRKMLLALYPKKSAKIDIFFKTMYLFIRADDSELARSYGAKIGNAAADAVLIERKYNFETKQFNDKSKDGYQDDDKTSLTLEPMFVGNPDSVPAEVWRPDPISALKVELGGEWGNVDPFVLTTEDINVKVMPEPPPPFTDPAFAESYTGENGVRKLGGDPNPFPSAQRHFTATTRVGDANPAEGEDLKKNQTFQGIFWAYDGTALLCAPPRLYNMIATSFALQEKPITDVHEFARYLALVNLALGDAGIAAWHAKYAYRHPRPVTYIRYHEPDVVIDGGRNRDWTPLGAPVSNGKVDRANLTPPFPAYPSGHAVFGAALFETMRLYYKDPPVAEQKFTFISDEYNGVNRGSDGKVRPSIPMTCDNFEEAIRMNADSRIYLGIHWKHDADHGIKQGKDVASIVFEALQLLPA